MNLRSSDARVKNQFSKFRYVAAVVVLAASLSSVNAKDGSITNFDFWDVSIGALLEVEGVAGREDGENVSSLALATVEVSLEGNINDWISAQAVILLKDGDDAMGLDTATI